MAMYMKQFAVLGTELEADERNLFSVAYKNLIGPKRFAWRIIVSHELKPENKFVENQLKLTRQVRFKDGIFFGRFHDVDLCYWFDSRLRIENEICDVVTDVIEVIDIHLLVR